MTEINVRVAAHERLRNDLEFYCRKALHIKTKSGTLEPYVWNKAQRYIHEIIEEQRERTGMVRAIIVKGRQQGCSTYVSARFFHRAAWEGHKNVYILSHEGVSTRNLLGKVETYRETCPKPVRPDVTISNRNELQFKNGSTYGVGTAGAKHSGRGQTNQLLHASECAYYENTDAVTSGILQTVADVPGTEIIIESTANGPGDYFHTTCKDAMAGRGLFVLIFVPWHWQDEYVATPPSGWEFSEDELELKRMYELSDAQLYWRYLKTLQLGSERLFKQEYPFSVAEAFQSSGVSFIPSIDIQKARKSEIKDPNAPMVLGVDPGRTKDRTVFAYRRGRELVKIKTFKEMTQTRLAGLIARELEDGKVDKVFIDTGMGYGAIDILEASGYKSEVVGVDFGSSPDEDRYLNKRAEMAFMLKDWLASDGVSIPDDEEIEVDILSIPDFKQTSRGKLSLESKDDIRKKYGRSPDIFDAIILTFAFPVSGKFIIQNRKQLQTVNTRKGSALKTLRRIRSMKRTETENIDDDFQDNQPKRIR